MIYSNSDPLALYAMEAARTGNYGEGNYGDEDEQTDICPYCGESEPEYFYHDRDMLCVGCSECIERAETLRGLHI